MRPSRKNFLFGLGIGIGLALLILQIWSNYVERSISAAAQPHILHPFGPIQMNAVPTSSEGLPHPWLPQGSGDDDHWRLTPLDGMPVTLAQLRGKVVFLNFWSTSCGPCIEEMPGIMRLRNSLRNEQIAFAAVTQEDGREVRDFLGKNRIDLPVYLSGQELPQSLQAIGLPTTYLIDRKGAAVFKHVGALNWDDDKARSYLLHLASQ